MADDRGGAGDGAGRALVLFAHGLGGRPERMEAVVAATRDAFAAADPPLTIVPILLDLPYGGSRKTALFTRKTPADTVAPILDEIDRRWAAGERYERIVLVGHSIGGLVMRKVAVLAHGELPEARFEPGYERFATPRLWADRITRLVMLAGMSKGWSPTSASNWATSFTWRMGMLLGTIAGASRAIVMESRRGLPFVVQTRLQWLALTRRLGPRMLEFVQILGTRDDFVAPDDLIDLAVDAPGEGKKFALLEMPDTDHDSILALARPRGPGDEDAGAVRWRIFARALTEPIADLVAGKHGIPPQMLDDGSLAKPDPTITDVAFVIHGIRDRGFWTQKVARRIKEEIEAAPPRRMRSMTGSYGYLAMLPFVLPGVRRAKTAWLMDRYVECRALYPEADFHYVGHSNGTYLGARALRDYPAARFTRVVFAGSVVSSRYDWLGLIRDRRQVDGLLNYVATSDLVVAAFPTGLGAFDLGGAGNSGFSCFPAAAPAPGGCGIAVLTHGEKKSYQLNYIRGGHSAGVKESQWDDIARFVVHGTEPRAEDADYDARQPARMRAIARASTIGLVPLALLILAGLAALFWWHPHIGIAVALLLAIFLTRF